MSQPAEAPGRKRNRAELILTGAKVLTADKDFSLGQASAVANGVIVAAGTDDEIRALAGPRTVEIDLSGRTVIPGLIDSHIHALRAGATWTSELHWEHLGSLAEGQAKIEERAAPSGGGWIRVAGGWHRDQLSEKRLPTSAELTLGSANCPVWVQHLYDRVVLNEAATLALDITADTPEPFGGEILRDATTGAPVGLAGFGAIRAYAGKLPNAGLDTQVARAAAAELTDLVDLSEWADGTRLIVRREPPHPGAQQSLFPSLAYRYWGHYSDAQGDPVDLDVDMRAHAHVET